MTATTTPRLALPYILAQQAQKEVPHAAALNRLDALVQPVVQQVGLSTPPGKRPPSTTLRHVMLVG